MAAGQTESDSMNPYQSPPEVIPRWFVWRRLPYAIICAWRGYRDEMRRQGSKATDHILAWFGLLVFGLIAVSLLMAILAGIQQLLPWTSIPLK